jgi:WXG100 family type VII secretion target
MAGSGFDTTLPTMDTASRHVHEVKGSLDGAIGAYRGKIATLTGGGVWRGDAQLSFTALQQEWDAGARKLNTALENIAEMLKTSSTEYDVREQDSRQGFSALQGTVR